MSSPRTGYLVRLRDREGNEWLLDTGEIAAIEPGRFGSSFVWRKGRLDSPWLEVMLRAETLIAALADADPWRPVGQGMEDDEA